MKIGLDCDDVLADFAGHLVRKYNQLYGTNYSVSEITPDPKRWIELFGQEESRKVWDIIWTPGFNISLPLVEGSASGVEELVRDEHELFVVTYRREFNHELTWKYLNDNFGQVFDELFCLVRRGGGHIYTKGQLCKMKGIDVMVEDLSENVVELVDRGIMTLVLDRSWNCDIAEGPLVKRVHSWPEIVDYVKPHAPRAEPK
jgi:5'(3')-deoxyribonucleotidase